MNVSQVVEIAKEWVGENSRQIPGFCGAHFAGSINRMSKEALFPIYSDVDIFIIVKDVKQICDSYPTLLRDRCMK
jgi:hypothetical protein